MLVFLKMNFTVIQYISSSKYTYANLLVRIYLYLQKAFWDITSDSNCKSFYANISLHSSDLYLTLHSLTFQTYTQYFFQVINNIPVNNPWDPCTERAKLKKYTVRRSWFYLWWNNLDQTK